MSTSLSRRQFLVASASLVLRPLGVIGLGAALVALLLHRRDPAAWGLAALAGLCVYLALEHSRWVWDALTSPVKLSALFIISSLPKPSPNVVAAVNF